MQRAEELIPSNCGTGEDSWDSSSWSRRSNQSILKEINLDYSLEGLMLKMKLQYFGHLMRRTDSLERTLMLGKIEDRSRRGRWGWDGWMASLAQWTWVWANSRSWWQRSLVCCSQWGHKESDTTEQLNNIKMMHFFLSPLRAGYRGPTFFGAAALSSTC